MAIREMYGAYSDAAMRQDRDLYLSLWCEDGVRVAEDGKVSGICAIAAHWDGLWSSLKQMGFFSEIAGITVNGATATAQVNCREIVVFKDDRIWKLVGRYEDALQKNDGIWRFKRRIYRILLEENPTKQTATI